jgi:hypothetical protein
MQISTDKFYAVNYFQIVVLYKIVDTSMFDYVKFQIIFIKLKI